MTALTAGTPQAVTATPPTVEQHIDKDTLCITLDISSGDVLVLLSRALRRCGLMHTFAHLGHAEHRLASQIDALMSEPTIRDALTVTLDEATALDLAVALDDATIAHSCDRCQSRYATADGLCNVCQPEVEP